MTTGGLERRLTQQHGPGSLNQGQGEGREIGGRSQSAVYSTGGEGGPGNLGQGKGQGHDQRWGQSIFVLLLFVCPCYATYKAWRIKKEIPREEGGGPYLVIYKVAELTLPLRPWICPYLSACVSQNPRFPLDGSGWIPALQCNTTLSLGDIGKHRFDITSSEKSQVWRPSLALKVGTVPVYVTEPGGGRD